jgi:phosphatidylglycerophosphatase A
VVFFFGGGGGEVGVRWLINVATFMLFFFVDIVKPMMCLETSVIYGYTGF